MTSEREDDIFIRMSKIEYDQFLILMGYCLAALTFNPTQGMIEDKDFREEMRVKLLEFIDELNFGDEAYNCYSEKFKKKRLEQRDT